MASVGLRSPYDDNEEQRSEGRHKLPSGNEVGGMAEGGSKHRVLAERPSRDYPVLKASHKQSSRFQVLLPRHKSGRELASGSRRQGGFLGAVTAQDVKTLCTGGLSLALKCGLILLARVFVEPWWPCLQLAGLCALCTRFFTSSLPHGAGIVLQPIRWLVKPVLCLTVAQPLVKLASPDLYRTARFWRRLLPIYFGYMRTKQKARHKSGQDKEKMWANRHEWGGVKVHQLVLDMSGFYVKSAQILASKADFVPEAWIKYLSRHLDDQPPRPFSEVALSIRQELAKCHRGPFLAVDRRGRVALDAVFAFVDPSPVASASIAQVHGAVLKDGTPVVVKVQHLGMENHMHSDLRNIARVAKFLQSQLPFDLTAIVREIQQTIPLEFDFEREVWFMTRIKQSLQENGFEGLVCPSPFTSLCTKRLIVMQRIDGVPFTRILHSETDKDAPQRSAELVPLVEHLLKAYGHMFLVDGIFHADPHAGNLLLLPDGRLGLLDFGQSKILDDETRMLLLRMVCALAGGTDADIANALTEMGMVFKDVRGCPVADTTLATMARIMFDTCYVEEATVSPMSDNSLLRTFPLTSFNQALWMVVRVLVLLRGLCFQLNMNVSAAAIWRPYAESQLKSLL